MPVTAKRRQGYNQARDPCRELEAGMPGQGAAQAWQRSREGLLSPSRMAGHQEPSLQPFLPVISRTEAGKRPGSAWLQWARARLSLSCPWRIPTIPN